MGKLAVHEIYGNDIAYHFSHFQLRLKERYNNTINIEQYMGLCKKPFTWLKKNQRGGKIGYVEFNNRNIVVVKKHGLLITALPMLKFFDDVLMIYECAHSRGVNVERAIPYYKNMGYCNPCIIPPLLS